jgi:type VI secretion system protein ImpA
MAEQPLLDFAALLAPIPGDDPAGGSVPFEVRHQLEEYRKEDNPDDFAPNDPLKPEKLRKADWPGIVRLARETLSHTSKDLLVAARLTEALARVHGFPGVRDGLHLLRELVEQCWDRLRPPIEDGDLEVRAAPFYWLDDADKGARFPSTVRMLPLIVADGAQYSWLDCRQSQKGEGPVTHEDFEKATLAMPAERCAAVAEAVAQGLAELDGLGRGLAEKMGPAAPAFAALREALDGCHALAQEIVRRKCPAGPPDADIPDEQPGAPAVPGARAASSRADLYRQVAQAAALLRELEPHSPIPYLLLRAVELGALPFPQLIKALLRDDNVLNELNRELGIKEPPPEG